MGGQTEEKCMSFNPPTYRIGDLVAIVNDPNTYLITAVFYLFDLNTYAYYGLNLSDNISYVFMKIILQV